MTRMGWHYSPCDRAAPSGGGVVAAAVVFAVVVGVVAGVGWLVGRAADAVGRVAAVVAPAVVPALVVVAVAVVGFVAWLVWDTRRRAPYYPTAIVPVLRDDARVPLSDVERRRIMAGLRALNAAPDRPSVRVR